MAPSEGLASKHREFVPIIAAIEGMEEAVGSVTRNALLLRGEQIQETLAHGLMPHAVGEGRAVFPVLRRMPHGTEMATELNQQHREIARLTMELERVHDRLAASGLPRGEEEQLRSLLHALRSTVSEHLEAEDLQCYAVLQAELTSEEAERVCRTMEETAAEVRRLYE